MARERCQGLSTDAMGQCGRCAAEERRRGLLRRMVEINAVLLNWQAQANMLMIARALTSEAMVLVLDEPESGLDFKNQLVILDLVRKLARQDGISCVFNTHYPAHALQIADKTLLLGRDGSSVFGNTGEIVSPERLRACFGVEVMIDAVQTPSGPYYSVIPVSVRED